MTPEETAQLYIIGYLKGVIRPALQAVHTQAEVDAIMDGLPWPTVAENMNVFIADPTSFWAWVLPPMIETVLNSPS